MIVKTDHTLLMVRSDLRSLIALDERGELDRLQRRDILRKAIADLQDYELRESGRVSEPPPPPEPSVPFRKS